MLLMIDVLNWDELLRAECTETKKLERQVSILREALIEDMINWIMVRPDSTGKFRTIFTLDDDSYREIAIRELIKKHPEIEW